MKLYEITSELTRYSEEDLTNPEKQLVLKEHLDNLQVAFENKVEQICKVIRDKELDREALDNEMSRLLFRRKAADSAAEWLRNYLKINMDSAGIPRIKTSLFGVFLSDSKPRIIIEALSEVPKDFVKTTISTVADKEKIAEYYKTTGEILPGVSIEQGKTLRIT